MSKALLVILDGFGNAKNPEVSAIDKAKKPYIDHLFTSNPRSSLIASGEEVGLPDGQFGNSEVGHLNIGAGRIVWQEISRIDKDIREGDFFQNTTLVEACQRAAQKGRIHLFGLFSDGGVHSHNRHLYALLQLCKSHGIARTFVHAFTDGRDTDPKAGLSYLREFEREAKRIGTGEIASIIGRYYAMDRDNRWERVQLAYDALVHAKGTVYCSAANAFEESYAEGVTDEFIKPVLIGSAHENRIKKDDVVIFFNFRGDRARELTRALTQPNFTAFPVTPLNLHYTCFTQYDETFIDVNVAFPPASFANVLGEVVSKAGKKQLRIAETEKYPHVTFFFNGGVEVPYEGEDRILIPSPKVATYDLKPEMSAYELTDALCPVLASGKHDLVILNFANPDMVGHTGDMHAAIKAIEAVDKCLSRIIPASEEGGFTTLIIADHGNADCMTNEDGSPNTAHTTQPVPCVLVNHPESVHLKNGILADVAPTLLKIIGLPQPAEMTGTPLF